MKNAPDEQIFTFVAVRADGTTPVLDIMACCGEAEALDRAKAWLADRSTCDRVQVWSEHAFVGEVTLGDAASPRQGAGRVLSPDE